MKESARDKTIADAKSGFRAFFAAYNAQLRTSSSSTMSPDLRKRTTGGVTQALDEFIDEMNNEGIYYDEDIELLSVEVSRVSEEWPSTKVVFDTCQDATKVNEVARATGKTGGGGYLIKTESYMELMGGVWRLAENYEEIVDEC